MAAKTKVARLESEIEKCRSDANWSKAVDLARQITTKNPGLENLASLVLGESRLERYLLENPPNDSNIPKAQEDVPQSRQLLLDVINNDPKASQKQEALLLLAKAHYAMGDYTEALKRLDEVGLETITVDDVSNRRLKLVGEGFAVKGLCLEKLPPSSTSKFQKGDREKQIISCFEKSGDLSLLQLQMIHDKGKATPTTMALQASGFWNLMEMDNTHVGPLVETAIQRCPIMYIRNGELMKGIGRFRELLSAVETRAVQGLRQILARQLAEVMMRGISPRTYQAIQPPTSLTNTTPSPAASPRKPRKYAGENLFVPQDLTEETLLLLLISESMATREAVLNRSPECTEARLHTFHNTTAVYDLLTIALVRRAQFSMLSETFERAMRFSFDEFHIWYQFALSLICADKYSRALLVLKECMKLQPRNPVPFLQAAKLCYDHLRLFDEGIKYSRTIVELGEQEAMCSRGFVALGVGHALKAEEARLQVRRQEEQRNALNAFIRAQALDKNDYLAEFHLALQLAILRQIPEALKHVKRSLYLRSDHGHSLHLLTLLLTAQKQYEEALDLIDAAVAEYPDNFHLLFTKCRLEQEVFGVEEALHTCKTMMKYWRDIFEATIENEQRGTGLLDRVTADHRSLVQLQLTELSDRDSGSMRAESVAASRVEQTLSEVASSIHSTYVPKQGPHQAWTLQSQIWLHLAELYLVLDRLDEAQLCINEASAIFPISYLVSYVRGRLHEHRGDLYDAKCCYESAVSINPAHVKSLQHLGMVLHKLGNNHLAEKVLRDCVNIDPTSSLTWQYLGKTLQSLEDFDAASECLATSVELEGTNPIVPFTIIHKSLQ